MKTEALEKADSGRKNQCSRKGKRQRTVVDVPFVLIIRPKKAQKEQDGSPCSHESQNEERRAERQKSARKTHGKDGEERREIEV
jgi:hypothetical protein